MFPTHIVAVICMVLDSEDNVLMVKHPIKGWELPGGIVEEGEDLVSALKREVFEETGINIEVKKLSAIYSNIHKDKHFNGAYYLPTKVIFAFTGEIISGELTKSNESIALGWFSKDAIVDMVLETSIRERIKDMLDLEHPMLYKAYSTNPYIVHHAKNI